MEMNPMVREKDGHEAEQAFCGTVEFTVRARKAKGIYFTSGDGMVRAMGLAETIETRPDRTMTVTTISGKNINEVTLTCDVRPVPGSRREALERMLQELCEAWDCEARIVSLHEGEKSGPEAGEKEERE